MYKMSSPTKPKVVLACDPGYDRLGIAVLSGSVHKHTILYSTCATTSKKDSHEKRLAALHAVLEKLIHEYEPSAIALETLFFARNTTSALKVAEARGMILALAGKLDIPVIEHSPQEVKMAVTGYGNAKKEEVIAMVKRLIPDISPKALDDEYDAIALSICAISSIR